MSSKQMMSNHKGKKAKKAALGRGLGSLLGEPSASESSPESTPKEEVVKKTKSNQLPKIQPKIKESFVESGEVNSTAEEGVKGRVWRLAVDKIEPNQEQPRKFFDKEALNSLAQSIREKGVIQPILVRKTKSGKYQIIAGERRWRASQLAGVHEVPAILKDSGEQDTLEMALIENIQREDLNPIEEALAYQHLMEKFDLTQQKLSEKVGKERATIANALRLLNLPEALRDLVAEGALSNGMAKLLLSVSSEQDQKKLAKKIIKQGLSVRAAEKLVAKHKNPQSSSEEENTVADTASAQLVDELQKLLGTKISLDYSKGKGRLTVHFYSDDELNEVVERVRLGCQKLI